MAGRPLTDTGILARQYGVSRRVINTMAMHVIPMSDDARTVMIAQSKAFGTYPSKINGTFPRSPRRSHTVRSERLAKLMAEIARRMTGDSCVLETHCGSHYRVMRHDASGRIDVI
jgi:hypothetical protein